MKLIDSTREKIKKFGATRGGIVLGIVYVFVLYPWITATAEIPTEEEAAAP